MGAGHKRRLSEAGLNAVTAIMGRQLTHKEFVRLTSGHWQPEPGLSYNPSGSFHPNDFLQVPCSFQY